MYVFFFVRMEEGKIRLGELLGLGILGMELGRFRDYSVVGRVIVFIGFILKFFFGYGVGRKKEERRK